MCELQSGTWITAHKQGAGNTVYPLLMHNENPDLTLWATDYSAQAVGVVKVSVAS